MRLGQQQNIEELFAHALELVPDERAAYLESACAERPEVKREVESLLRAHEQAGEFISDSIILPSCAADTNVGRTIGRYRLLERIGAGGMGNVYLAERSDAEFQQRVAIKLIRRGLDTEDILQRFRQERQVLATLEHPNIARLIDGGSSEDGLPYIVMEYVEGVQINCYCDENRLDLDARLNLFVRLCEVVQFAHNNLVVHRDLKPANILMTTGDELKLLDFGISKVLDWKAERSLDVTASHQRRFTPAYASPEQFRDEPISTTTDVYSLGVIHYELLTGLLPRSAEEALASTRADADERTLPTRLGRAFDEIADPDTRDRALVRMSTPERLRKKLRGDLETIAITALQADRDRRYSSVQEFRDDVVRYQKGLPITARPDTWQYRTVRFVKRNARTVAAIAVVALLMLVATVTSTWLAIRLANKSRDLQNSLEEQKRAYAEVDREFRRARSAASTLINTVTSISNEDDGIRAGVVDEIRARTRRLNKSTVPLSPETEIATRQALAMMAGTVGAQELVLENSRRIIALAEGRPGELRPLTEAWSQIGLIHLQRNESSEAVAALTRSIELIVDMNQSQYLTFAHLYLVEAHLQLGQIDNAVSVLKNPALPEPPMDALMRNAISELETRFGVSLQDQ